MEQTASISPPHDVLRRTTLGLLVHDQRRAAIRRRPDVDQLFHLHAALRRLTSRAQVRRPGFENPSNLTHSPECAQLGFSNYMKEEPSCASERLAFN